MCRRPAQDTCRTAFEALDSGVRVERATLKAPAFMAFLRRILPVKVRARACVCVARGPWEQ